MPRGLQPGCPRGCHRCHGKDRAAELLNERTFAQATEAFQTEYEVITGDQRSAKWVDGHKAHVRLHLVLYFGKMGPSQVTSGAVQDYRVARI